MESEAIRSEGRSRKRKKNDVQNVNVERKRGRKKKQVVEMKLTVLVGRYLLKEFEGSGIFLGKIVFYDTGLYRVAYEDGDCEDLDSSEIRGILLSDSDFDDDLVARRKKLDELVSKNGVSITKGLEKKAVESANGKDKVEASTLSEVSGGLTIEIEEEQVEGDRDSSSDSCEHARDRDFEAVAPLVPPPQLPPSSGNIGVPEEYVSHLFSVYGFLRSFSIRLFLSPFRLDDFVGCLNSCVPNTLLDAIHVVLMRALRWRLETLSSEGSELASKYFRYFDWSLLDTLTWPVFLVQYLTVMGYVKKLEWKGFYDEILVKEYYSLPAGRKLMILQILCDDALDSEELRAELDIREESEFGIDSDAVVTNPPENGSRRIHPRNPKTSMYKDGETVESFVERHEMKSSCISNPVNSKGPQRAADTDSVGADGNSDECRLCGMDGTLLCCDGCPSAYHSRCIGVSKMHMPKKSWYCPECRINKIGLTITVGTSLRGAEIFGIDSYGQVFLGTCNHLLVLNVSMNIEPCIRYYNQNDIPKVLQALSSSGQHLALYSGICNAIIKYWDIPESILPLPEVVEWGIDLANMRKDVAFSTLSLPSRKKNCQVFHAAKAGNNERSINESDVEVSCPQRSLNTATQTDSFSMQRSGETITHVCSYINNTLPEQIKVESALSTGSGSQKADPSDLTRQSFADRSSAIGFATCTPGNSSGSYSGHLNGMCLPANTSSQSKENDNGRVDRNSVDHCVYIGSLYKPQAYINNYMHGYFAASAAANLAILSSEENRVSEAHASVNLRKVISANISLQAKAFSSTANRFFWPSSEKKLVEVPRERCGWCHSCKAPIQSRRKCLLSSAALHVTKDATKILAGLHPVTAGESVLPSITTYLLYMEESLSGLIVGPFQSESCRQQWRKQVEQASTCSTIKALLLEFEENIRTIALSGNWVKLVENSLVESSVIQSTTCTTGTTQKREQNGRRNRKHSAISEVTEDGRRETFSWWRRGKLSKLIFSKGILPHSLVRKAARQGGLSKISALYYANGPEIPKRSRQLVWRAAVEASKNASQLAIQVRYLDLHVRWSDLVCPEQNLPDGKGAETEASAFRNAIICDKKIVENKITYGVAFGNQKHFPSRVMKNIIGIEQSQDGKDKYWFLETHIPLYLIKEHEGSAAKILLPSAQKPSNLLSKLQKRQLKASRRDLFSYLTRKRENLGICSCASCQRDVLLRNAVTCNACQGYCHKDCTASSKADSNVEAEFLITCKQCYNGKVLARKSNNGSPPSSEGYNTGTITKGTRHKGFNQPLASVRTQESCSEARQTTSDPKSAKKSKQKFCNWGIIWKKKNHESNDADFRLKNILLRGSTHMNLLKPVCRLCRKPYNPDLMYICCETCRNWFHAEAVELEESKVLDVVGFKCCKCRRIRSPECPYGDKKQDDKRQGGTKLRIRLVKEENSGVDSLSGIISEPKELEPTTPMFPTDEVFIQDEDPLLFSLSSVEQITGRNSDMDLDCNTASCPGLQKLPVRRHVKQEGDLDDSFGNNLTHADISETNNLLKPTETASSLHAEWESINSLEGNMMFDYEAINYEDMEFEPQTYFSFTELLESEDTGQLDGVDTSGTMLGDLENSFSAISRDEVPEQYGMDTSDRQLEYTFVNPSVEVVNCRACSHTEPTPDLSCQVCGLWLHSHCTPWVDSSAHEGSWICGNCREWR